MVSRPPRRNAILFHGILNASPHSPAVTSDSHGKLQTDSSTTLLREHCRAQGSSPTIKKAKLSKTDIKAAQRKVRFSDNVSVREYDAQHKCSLWWTSAELQAQKNARMKDIKQAYLLNRYRPSCESASSNFHGKIADLRTLTE